MGIRVISFGGGQQSTALLVLAGQGVIDYRTFLFANVGDDSEHPATLAYIAEHPRLFARACELESTLVERRERLGRDPAYLTGLGRPLAEAIPDGVDLLPLADDDAGCDSGWCMT
ncbi:hypothetical protein [Streptomyces sp. URMC 129]|uniref:hypothetical protein n=1 Tax=Streptomyces sp. URMC 129 TaxID=3423407 RepID=UPI003F1B7B76